MSVRTRFAPSPTGVLHIGGVRTALFSWLYARHHGGQFVLRIEDTDRDRSTRASVDAIIEGMRWLGLDADEGPYHQLDRLDRYREVAEGWLQAGHAYHCYCTPAELEEMRAGQIARGENPGYDGRCRNRDPVPANVEPVVRFRMPQDGTTVVRDLVRGDVEFDNKLFDDLIIVRADGLPTYNFSVVIDDADMDITHVIRGDDHLNNTPKQLSMYAVLGRTAPRFAHVPMILGEDGSRLSKRHGAVNVLDYRTGGYLPEALLNYLVRLGWSHGDQELFSIDEMIGLFDIADVNQSASSFNHEKLDWLNQHYIKAASTARLVDELRPQLDARAIDPSQGPRLEDLVEAYRERAKTMAEMAESSRYCFEDFDEIEANAARKHLRPVILEPMRDLRRRLAALGDWQPESLAAALRACAEGHDINLGKIGQPVRVGVTGGSVSPPIDVTLALIGRDRGLARLDRAIELIERRAANR